ncbi:hypothetical protein PRIPAC_80701 [Pristionchus pacificus]|nr:hypothetical protein PRIPAC_80701 [Pristionchus pacificus]
MIGRLLLVSSLLTLFLTRIITANVDEIDCLDTLNECYKNDETSDIITFHSRTAHDIFHYCEQTRTRVIPCVAKSLNITLGPTAYDKGAFLYSCPYNKNKGSKKIMQDQGKGYLLNCVYNDIRNMQHMECFEYMLRNCGIRNNKGLSQCAFVAPCPNSEINAIYKRTVIHATSQKKRSVGESKGVNPQGSFKKGKSEETTTSISISTTVSISLLSLITAFIFH